MAIATIETAEFSEGSMGLHDTVEEFRAICQHMASPSAYRASRWYAHVSGSLPATQPCIGLSSRQASGDNRKYRQAHARYSMRPEESQLQQGEWTTHRQQPRPLCVLEEKLQGGLFLRFGKLSGIRESNPPPRLGKPVHYRCANSALLIMRTNNMEPIPGLEPGTHALRMRCSTN